MLKLLIKQIYNICLVQIYSVYRNIRLFMTEYYNGFYSETIKIKRFDNARIPKNLGRQSLPKDTGLGVRLKVMSRGQTNIGS